MLVKELIHCPHFSLKEINDTGSDLSKINIHLMKQLEMFRVLVNTPIKLISITDGTHVKNSQHYLGKAVDIYFIKEPNLSINDIVELALNCNFKGIGAYNNGVKNSFHFDLRDKYQLWSGVKSSGIYWKYGNLIKELL